MHPSVGSALIRSTFTFLVGRSRFLVCSDWPRRTAFEQRQCAGAVHGFPHSPVQPGLSCCCWWWFLRCRSRSISDT